MAKQRKTDAGLEYIKRIGFERIRGQYGLQYRLEKYFGKEKAHLLLDKRHKIEDGSIEFYEFKNSDPLLSKAFSEAYDEDIIRKACNYVSEHKEHFGKTILEVGCESGYMTGFLAETFPEAKIVSIDRSSAALNNAKERLSKSNITNVEFINCSLGEVEEQFDTVFCMRTIQENLKGDSPFYGEAFLYQCEKYAEETEEYTDLLLSRIKETGNLVVFERVGHNPLMCGWLLKLNEKSCGIDFDTYEEIEVEEAGTTNTFQAFVCQKGNSVETQDIFDLWYEAMDIDFEGQTELDGWLALAYLSDNAGDLVRGVKVVDNDEKTIGRFAVFTDCDDESLFYYLFAPGQEEMNVKLFSGNRSIKDEMLEELQSVCDTNKKLGWKIVELNPEIDYIEGNAQQRSIDV